MKFTIALLSALCFFGIAAQANYPSNIDGYRCPISVKLNGGPSIQILNGTILVVDEITKRINSKEEVNMMEVRFQLVDLTPVLSDYLSFLLTKPMTEPRYSNFASRGSVVAEGVPKGAIETFFQSPFNVPMPSEYNENGVTNSLVIQRSADGNNLSMELRYSQPSVGVESLVITGNCNRDVIVRKSKSL